MQNLLLLAQRNALDSTKFYDTVHLLAETSILIERFQRQIIQNTNDINNYMLEPRRFPNVSRQDIEQKRNENAHWRAQLYEQQILWKNEYTSVVAKYGHIQQNTMEIKPLFNDISTKYMYSPP
jgi:hypothetical protein